MKSKILCFVCFLLIGTSVQAWDVVNINFQRDSGPTETAGGAAFGPDVPMYWNNYYRSTATLTDVLDSESNATTVDITANQTDGYWDHGAMFGSLVYGNNIMNNYVHQSNQGYKDMTIAGLTPNAYYDLYLYGHGDAEAQNTIFTIAGVSKSSTIDVAGLTELTENAHYVIFSDVLADSSGQIIVNWGADTYAAINGMQILPTAFVRGRAHTPVPEHLSPEVDSESVSSVSWYSPEQDANGDPLDDPNIVSISGYDVYWSITEPNYLTDTPVSVMQSGQTFNPTDYTLPAITYETTYYWRVDTYVVWDSNDITGNFTDIVEGKEWQFTTLQEYLVPVLTFDNIITTQDLLPAALSASVTHNSDEITSVTFTLLEDDFEFPAGAAAALTNTTVDNQNPTATLTTDTAGTYKVKLAVSDGTTDIETIAEIVVYADACQAKKDSPSGWTADYFDINEDCIINLLDFADMADEWLNTTIMEAAETYAGGPAFSYLPGDILIDSADVYSLTDPDYVSEPPLEVDAGGPRIATHADAYGGSVIGYTDPNDFVTYEIEIPAGQGGDYTVYVANAFPSGSARSIAFGTVSPDGNPFNDDITAYGTLALADGTGWGEVGAYSQYKVDSGTMSFSEGIHLVRVTWIDGAFNLDYIVLKKE